MARTLCVTAAGIGLVCSLFLVLGCNATSKDSPAPTAPLTGEALFKSVVAKFVQAKFDLRDTVAANRNETINGTAGKYLSIILSVDEDFNRTEVLLEDVPPANAGATCLALDKQIASDMAQVLAHADDTIDGTTVPGQPLKGEQLYQQQLLTFGIAFRALMQAGTDPANKALPYPGPWLQNLLRVARASLTVQAVAANNDSTPACLSALLELAQANQASEAALS